LAVTFFGTFINQKFPLLVAMGTAGQPVHPKPPAPAPTRALSSFPDFVHLVGPEPPFPKPSQQIRKSAQTAPLVEEEAWEKSYL